MVTKKFVYYVYDKDSVEFVYPPSLTTPNQAFSPREIIEQFSKGEVIAEENTPTDDYYDDKYSEEQLVGLVQVDDPFLARQYLIDFEQDKENSNPGSNDSSDVNSDKTLISSTHKTGNEVASSDGVENT